MPAQLLIDQLASRVVREALGASPYSQGDLAKILGLARTAVNRRLNGGYAWTLGELVLIGGWLGTDLLQKVAEAHRASRPGRAA